ncbi:MAG TPA: GntR family transcriptional regulator YhfZ [Candidatus Limnocylindrales bacterium]|nr:GntR family transcriptional regulator YhfZ [Candidatus Limnocylindrales bacterium]
MMLQEVAAAENELGLRTQVGRHETVLLSRAGSTAAAISWHLLSLSPGDRLPAVGDLARRFGVGVNTVQRALAVVEAEAGVVLDARGRHGTFLVELDRVRLWRLAGQDQLLGLMPLPYSRRYEGLATGLRQVMSDIGIASSLAFMSGSRRRLDALARGEVFAVISGLALEEARREGHAITPAVEMAPGSFVESHGVIRRRRPAQGRLRVGIDPDSIDQSLLSRAEFGEHATYRPMQYMQIIESVRRDLVDAAVWVLDTAPVDDVIETAPLTTHAALALDRVATQAVLAVREDDDVLAKFLSDHVDVNTVLRIQRQVLKGTRIPSY